MTALAESPPDAPDPEGALSAFIERLPGEAPTLARTLAHAWTSGGGSIQVGNVAVRLLGNDRGRVFTAGTLHAKARKGDDPCLEFARVLLESHGIGHDDWIHWSDEFADLGHHGFEPTAKFPTLHLDHDLTPAELARLASGLRDLARMTGA